METIGIMWNDALRHDRVVAQYASNAAASDYAQSYFDDRPSSRFFRSRLRVVLDALAAVPEGDLLDAGCGPGMLIRNILASRQDDFSLTALDQSHAMIQHCADNIGAGNVRPVVGSVESMPFPSSSFDVTLATGVLEYTDATATLREIARVTKEKGLVIVSMLNPFSFYRLTEWFVYWPLRRALGAVEDTVGLPRRHGADATGIHALFPGDLRRRMRRAGLQPNSIIYFDVTVLVPPLDRFPALTQAEDRLRLGQSAARWRKRFLSTGYLVIARRL